DLADYDGAARARGEAIAEGPGRDDVGVLPGARFDALADPVEADVGDPRLRPRDALADLLVGQAAADHQGPVGGEVEPSHDDVADGRAEHEVVGGELPAELAGGGHLGQPGGRGVAGAGDGD